MRTKLFSAFILIILLAFISNVAFERLIIKDFDDFLKGTSEDRIYWVMASVEGSFKNNAWDNMMLNEALHWGLMLGFESSVKDKAGNNVLSSSDVLSTMSPNMLNRMNSFFDFQSGKGEFTWYPLYVGGEEVGRLYVRPIERLGPIPMKEELFRQRGKEFLITSFLIAGGGALLLAFLITFFISNPIRRLTNAAERIARGDFPVHKPVKRKTGFFHHKDEIDRLTGTFQYMAEALKREDMLRKRLTSNVAHELRTPLTIIKGNLEAIEDGVVSDPKEAIKNIGTEIQRLISLVEGIEDITSAEASFFRRGNIEEIDLKDFVESVASGMEGIFKEKGLYLKKDGPPVLVGTYPEKLHIILKNLLTNAYKFTDKGGVTIRWGGHKQPGNGGFYLTVEDTGRGIPEKEVPMIFERFYKGKYSDGKGLGLAIVKELAEIMGGKIEVESAQDKGSRFTVKF